MKFLNFYKSIRLRLISLYIMLVIIPVILCGAYMFNRFSDIISRNTSDLIMNNLGNVAENIDTVLKNIENMQMFIASNDRFIESIKELKPANELNDYLDYIIQKQISDNLFDYTFLNQYVNSIYLYCINSKIMFQSLGSEKITANMDLDSNEWYQNYLRSEKLNIRWSVSKRKDKENKTEDNIISLYKPIKEFTYEKPIGILSININEVVIYRLLSKIKLHKTGYAFVIDNNGKVISHKNRELVNTNLDKETYIQKILRSSDKNYFIDKIGNNQYLITFYKSDYSGWRYIALVPISEVNESADIFRFFIMIIYCIIAVSAFLGIFFVIRGFYRPMKVLIKSMNSVRSNGIPAFVANSREDEFGYIFNNYNEMLIKLEENIDKLYVQELLVKDAKLKLIQSQIDEHFIYNTLDSVHWMARIYKVDLIADMVRSISKYFRICLSEGQDVVAIKEIVEMLECYLEIQKIRHKGKLEVEINVQEELLETRVLKYLFQPLVENAVHHGIEKKSSCGHIRICFENDGEILKFSVYDDGVGIHPEELKQIVESLEDNEVSGKNFALKNVNSQIKIFYGNDYGLWIRSEESQFTEVGFGIPLKIRSRGESDV